MFLDAVLNPLQFSSVLNFLTVWWVFACLCEGFHDFCLQYITQKLLALLRPLLCWLEVPRQNGQGLKIAATEVKSWLRWLQWEFCHRWKWAKTSIQKQFSLFVGNPGVFSREAFAFLLPPRLSLLGRGDRSLLGCHAVPFTSTAFLGRKSGQIGVETKPQMWTHADCLVACVLSHSQEQGSRTLDWAQLASWNCRGGICQCLQPVHLPVPASAFANYWFSDRHSICEATVHSLIQPYLACAHWVNFLYICDLVSYS